MVLLFILTTLLVLAVSINLSEKVINPRRNSKVSNKSAYKNKYYKFFKNNIFRLDYFRNRLQGKSKKRNSRIETKKRCEKKNDNIIPWPKD